MSLSPACNSNGTLTAEGCMSSLSHCVLQVQEGKMAGQLSPSPRPSRAVKSSIHEAQQSGRRLVPQPGVQQGAPHLTFLGGH